MSPITAAASSQHSVQQEVDQWFRDQAKTIQESTQTVSDCASLVIGYLYPPPPFFLRVITHFRPMLEKNTNRSDVAFLINHYLSLPTPLHFRMFGSFRHGMDKNSCPHRMMRKTVKIGNEWIPWIGYAMKGRWEENETTIHDYFCYLPHPLFMKQGGVSLGGPFYCLSHLTIKRAKNGSCSEKEIRFTGTREQARLEGYLQTCLRDNSFSHFEIPHEERLLAWPVVMDDWTRMNLGDVPDKFWKGFLCQKFGSPLNLNDWFSSASGSIEPIDEEEVPPQVMQCGPDPNDPSLPLPILKRLAQGEVFV
jgi:hypothetical protein